MKHNNSKEPTILISAATVKYGGGRGVVLNFLRALRDHGSGMELVLLAPPSSGYGEFEKAGIRTIYVPSILLIRFFRFLFDWAWFPWVSGQIKPDAILNFGNLPLITGIHQMFYHDNPFATTGDLTGYGLSNWQIWVHRLRNKLLAKRIRYISSLVVQTDIEKRKFIERFSYSGPVVVIPNTFGILETDVRKPGKRFLKEEGTKYILLFSRYYPHKNMEVLLEVAKLLKERGDMVHFLLTIETSQGRGASKFLKSIGEQGLEQFFINLGEISTEDIPALFKIANALMLPTLLESYSANYPEAMYYRVPILTSDMDFSKEVCGDHAWYFDPHSPEDIYATIKDLINDPMHAEGKVLAAHKAIMNANPGWEPITVKIITQLRKEAGLA
jgi:glycosyltransferase involved in cell wall biosynthesis